MNIKSLSLAFATAALSLTAAAAGKVNVSLNPSDSAPVIEPKSTVSSPNISAVASMVAYG